MGNEKKGAARRAPTGSTAGSAAGSAAGSRRPTSTPFGPAQVRASVSVAQRAPGARFAVVAELLETAGGEPLVRLAYTTEGRVRRGPITLRPADLVRLRSAIDRKPELRAMLGDGW